MEECHAHSQATAGRRHAGRLAHPGNRCRPGQGNARLKDGPECRIRLRLTLDLANARDPDAFDRAIDIRITRIRRKIEPDPARPSVIRTVRGAGYVFSPEGKAT